MCKRDVNYVNRRFRDGHTNIGGIRQQQQHVAIYKTCIVVDATGVSICLRKRMLLLMLLVLLLMLLLSVLLLMLILLVVLLFLY